MRRIWQVATVVALAGFGCEERIVEPVDVSRVELQPQVMTLRAGATSRFEALLFDASGNTLSGRAVEWSVDDSDVGAIANNGTVIAIAPGQASVVASSGGRQGLATLRVTSNVVASIEVVPVETTVVFGNETALVATVRADDGTIIDDRSVTWTSAASAIASVSPSGVVRGVGIGRTTISASIDGVIGQAAIEVTAPVLARIDIVPAAASLEIGETVQLGAVGLLASGDPVPGLPFAWRSLNTNVAVVDASGAVTAVGPGDAVIEAGFGNVTGQATVAVAPIRAATIEVTPASATLFVADRLPLVADVRDADGNVLDRDLIWTSDVPAVATVDATGVVTGVAPGETWVKAVLDAGRDSAFITVEARRVSRVQVLPAAASLEIDEAVALSALVFAPDGTILSRPVAWETDAPAIATVTQLGVVTAHGAGIATISATADGVTGTASITVGPPVASISVTPDPLEIRAGESGQMSAEARTEDGDVIPGAGFAWSSDDTQIARVDAAGRVTGIGAGTTEIRATIGAVVGTATVEVAPPPIASITITPTSLSLDFGATGQLTAVARDAGGTVLPAASFSWTSDATSIATVSQTGLVTGTGAGATTITASADGVEATASVTVAPPPFVEIEVRPDSVEIDVSGSTTLDAVGITAGGDDVPISVTWSSASGGVATVNGAGLVTGVAPGKTTITATSGGVQGTAVVIVGRDVAVSVSIEQADFELEQTNTRQLTATARNVFGDAVPASITWSSSNTAIATVNSSGRVTAVAEGSAQIVARAGALQDDVTVTVPPAPVDRIVVEPNFVVLEEDETVQLTITIYDVFDNVVDRPVTWTTSANAVARVDSDGLVTARREGVAVIRATVEGKFDTTTIVVTDDNPVPVPQ